MELSGIIPTRTRQVHSNVSQESRARAELAVWRVARHHGGWGISASSRATGCHGNRNKQAISFVVGARGQTDSWDTRKHTPVLSVWVWNLVLVLTPNEKNRLRVSEHSVIWT